MSLPNCRKSISMNELLLPFEIRQREIFVSALVSLRLLEVTKARGRNEKEKLYSNSQLADDELLNYLLTKGFIV